MNGLWWIGVGLFCVALIAKAIDWHTRREGDEGGAMRWIACLFGWHRNARAVSLGWCPLFPVRCDDCHSLFYMRRKEAPHA